MLDKLPEEVWIEGKTFCDQAVGNGQFLIHVLWRKIYAGHKPLDALKTVYGADIMRDNIRECRMRLLKLISIFEPVVPEHIEAVMQNIVWVNPHRYPAGSLDYDLSFGNKPRKHDVECWMKSIHDDNVLNEVSLPPELSVPYMVPEGIKTATSGE
jgi:hypothetical protein